RRFGEVITLSAKTGAGIDALQGAVEALFPPEQGQPGQLLTNARQADAVGRALDAVTAALDSLRRGLTPDAVLTDAEAALAALGELNGKNIREDLVDTIFSRFCVGK
ncbi:MAG: tRNA uridine-5-carboxymethylaminomethyl(34) synthesis GTPase MnmE, partial [Oscillospiraceae bacterium]|nr:tRNA uridine-5-carboxymethylaminomethyl(34) synthesis GTPase MnmE [Oscillospiraceae bacterium]